MSTFEKNLDALERTALEQGYNWAIEDLNKILQESIDSATTTNEMLFALKVQKLMFQMSEVRFPATGERQN